MRKSDFLLVWRSTQSSKLTCSRKEQRTFDSPGFLIDGALLFSRGGSTNCVRDTAQRWDWAEFVLSSPLHSSHSGGTELSLFCLHLCTVRTAEGLSWVCFVFTSAQFAPRWVWAEFVLSSPLHSSHRGGSELSLFCLRLCTVVGLGARQSFSHAATAANNPSSLQRRPKQGKAKGS